MTMTTTSGTVGVVEGVDNDVLLAFVALLVITMLTVLYFLNASGGISSTFSGVWLYLTTSVEATSRSDERQSSTASVGGFQDVHESREQDQQQTSQSTEQSQSGSENHSDNGPSLGQAEGHFREGLRQTTGERPGPSEDKKEGTPRDDLNQERAPSSRPSETETEGTYGEGLRYRAGHSADAGSSQSTNEESSAPQLSLRVKHHEVERNFVVDPSITVGELKRLSFPDETAQGRRVRFVYSGRLLHDESARLSFYGVTNYSVIHAQISDMTQQNSPLGQNEEDIELDISRLFIPLLTFILCGCWYGLITYRQLFNTTSTAILLIVTAAYGFMVYVIFA